MMTKKELKEEISRLNRVLEYRDGEIVILKAQVEALQAHHKQHVDRTLKGVDKLKEDIIAASIAGVKEAWQKGYEAGVAFAMEPVNHAMLKMMRERQI